MNLRIMVSSTLSINGRLLAVQRPGLTETMAVTTPARCPIDRNENRMAPRHLDE